MAIILPDEGPAETVASRLHRQLAIEIGKELERRGITEEDAMAGLEKVKQQVFEERYGSIEKYKKGSPARRKLRVEDKDLSVQDESTARLRKRLKVLTAGTFLREVMGWTSEQLEQVRGRSWRDLEGTQGITE